MSIICLIRTNVFKLRQGEFAALIGVSQPTVSRWEAGNDCITREQLSRIRDGASDRGIAWNDRWFFDPPEEPILTDDFNASSASDPQSGLDVVGGSDDAGALGHAAQPDATDGRGHVNTDVAALPELAR